MARRGFCPSGKRRYRRRIDAELALTTIRNNSTRDRVPRRVYRCGLCGGGWHLTSE